LKAIAVLAARLPDTLGDPCAQLPLANLDSIGFVV
jgi:hypothetical protein